MKGKRKRQIERKKEMEERQKERKKQNAITVDIAEVLRSAHGCNMYSGSGALMHVLADAAAPLCASFPPPLC